MFTLPNVLNLFTHEFASLGGRRFAFAFVFTRPFNCLFIWHSNLVSPGIACLDVKEASSNICGRIQRHACYVLDYGEHRRDPFAQTKI